MKYNKKKTNKFKSKKKINKNFLKRFYKLLILKPFFYLKNIINHYFIHLILSIFIIISTIYYFNNKKENFFNFFNKELDSFPDRKVNYINDDGKRNLRKENIITKNNSIQDTTYTPMINNKSKLPPVNKAPMRIKPDNNELLNKVQKPENNLKPVGQSLFGTLQCKVVTECPDGYYNTGAEFNGTICQNNNDIKQAKAVASIKNGYIDNIYIIDNGLGYQEIPKIKITGGNGIDAHATCVIENNKVKNIELQNRGRNYNSTPKIEIEAPTNNHICKLCCLNNK